MSEHVVFEYLVNAVWQIPLLSLGAGLMIRITRPPLIAQHLLWIAALGLAVLLPLRGVETIQAASASESAQYEARSGETQGGAEAILDTDPMHSTAVEPGVGGAAVGQANVAPMTTGFSALRVRRVTLDARAIHWAVCLYAAVLALSLARLIRSCVLARRYVETAVDHPLTALESSLLQACARRLGIAPGRIPLVRFLKTASASPLVFGIRNPVLLLPEAFRHTGDSDFNDEALAAILSHELAHIRRRDFAANLLCRIVALPVAWHPATAVIQGRIRQTREMICDLHAAGSLDSSSYARALLLLASRIIDAGAQPAAVGLFDHSRSRLLNTPLNTLEERIMKLTETKQNAGLAHRTARIAAGSMVVILATAAAASFHIRPAEAASSAAPQTEGVVLAQAVVTPRPVEAGVVLARPVVATASGQKGTQAMAAPAAASAPALAGQEAVPAGPSLASGQVTGVAQVPSVPPVPSVAPVPSVEPVPGVAPVPVHGGGYIVLGNGEERDLTPAERAAVDKQVAAAQKQIAAMTQKFWDPAFQKQFADNFKAFQAPEFAKKMAEMQKSFNTPEFRERMKKLNAEIARSRIDLPELNRGGEGFGWKIEGPAIRKQIEEATRMAREEVARSQERIAETHKQLDAASQAIAEARRQTSDGKLQQQLDEAQRRIDEAAKVH